MDFWEAENAWYWHAPVSRLAKALAQWEVYKSILGLPGEIAEFGTYKAASLIRLATFREIAESAQSRRIVAFDAFGRFPPPQETASDDDVAFVERFEGEGGVGLSVDETAATLQAKGLTNVQLVAGDIAATLPGYVQGIQSCGWRLSMLTSTCTMSPGWCSMSPPHSLFRVARSCWMTTARSVVPRVR